MVAMETRHLGKHIKAKELGFGCMSLTAGFYGTSQDIDAVESEKVLRAALDSGISLLNTADFYTGFGPDEEVSGNIKLIGKVMKDYPRESVVVAMKWGPWIVPGKGFAPMDLSPKALRSRIDDALKILGSSYIDIVTIRLGVGPDANGVTLEETAKALKELVDEGKIKAVGISEATLDQAKTINSVVPVSAVELEWSLFNRDSEDTIIPWARSVGAGIMAYSPMARGMLTGKVEKDNLSANDFRKTHGGQWQDEAYENNMRLVEEVKKLAAQKGCTAGQLALAWVLAQGDDVIPIPGTKRTKYLEENVKALNFKLTPAEVKELTDTVPHTKVAGPRHRV